MICWISSSCLEIFCRREAKDDFRNVSRDSNLWLMAWVCSLRKSRESTSRWLAVELIRLYLGEVVVNRCFESQSEEGVFGLDLKG